MPQPCEQCRLSSGVQPACRAAGSGRLARDKCFSTEQIRTISQLAPFGEEKIAMFKKLHTKCTDKGNYYKLVDELKFSQEQKELTDFIQ